MATWLVTHWFSREESKRSQLFSVWSDKTHDDRSRTLRIPMYSTATTNDTESVLRKNHIGDTHDQGKQRLVNNIGGRYQRIPIWRCFWEVISASKMLGCGVACEALHAPPRKLSLDQIHMLLGVRFPQNSRCLTLVSCGFVEWAAGSEVVAALGPYVSDSW